MFHHGYISISQFALFSWIVWLLVQFTKIKRIHLAVVISTHSILFHDSFTHTPSDCLTKTRTTVPMQSFLKKWYGKVDRRVTTISHIKYWSVMMTLSNGSIFRVIVTLWGESAGSGGFPSRWPVTRSFDVSFDLRLNKWLSTRSRRLWFETPSHLLWRHCNGEDISWDVHKERHVELCSRSASPIDIQPLSLSGCIQCVGTLYRFIQRA